MRRFSWSSYLLVLGLACVAPLFMAARAHAVTVQVSPADTTVTFGDTFKLRVVTNDAVADLKAYSLGFRYGSGIQYLGPVAGDVLTGSGSPYTVNTVPDVAAPADTAWADCAQLLTSTHTPGVLLYFRFKAIAYIDSPIECLNVDFRDSQNNVTLPGCVGALVHVTGPTPTRNTTWGKVKAIYR